MPPPDGGPPKHGTIAGPAILAPSAPPRKYALAARAGGGAIFAYRKVNMNGISTPDVWLADFDAGGLEQRHERRHRVAVDDFCLVQHAILVAIRHWRGQLLIHTGCRMESRGVRATRGPGA